MSKSNVALLFEDIAQLDDKFRNQQNSLDQFEASIQKPNKILLAELIKQCVRSPKNNPLNMISDTSSVLSPQSSQQQTEQKNLKKS